MSATSYDESPQALAYRLRQSEAAVKELAEWRRSVDTSRAAEQVVIENMAEAMQTLSATVESLRRTIIGFALSIAGSAVVFALSILVATGKVG